MLASGRKRKEGRSIETDNSGVIAERGDCGKNDADIA
jgi:hypothetical protein